MRVEEVIKQITNWDYYKSIQVEDDEILHQFGFKDGVHFYLSEYLFEDELGKWLLSAWKNTEHIMSWPLKEFLQVQIEINKILHES